MTEASKADDVVELVAARIYSHWPTQFSTLEPTTDSCRGYERRWGRDSWQTTCEIDPCRAEECRAAARAVIAVLAGRSE